MLVKPKDTASVLADAAEEISMAHSEKVEHKVFSDRKFEIESPMDLMGIREIQAYLRAAGKLNAHAWPTRAMDACTDGTPTSAQTRRTMASSPPA